MLPSSQTVTVLTRERTPHQSSPHQLSPLWDVLERCILIAMLSLKPMHRMLLILALTPCTDIFKNKYDLFVIRRCDMKMANNLSNKMVGI